MPLWKPGGFIDDDWRVLPDDAPLPDGDKVVVSLKRWRAEHAALAARNAPLGLMIAAGEKWDDVVADLPRFPVIVVTIPKYADGRASRSRAASASATATAAKSAPPAPTSSTRCRS